MEAKQHGKNQLRFYSPEISQQLRERLELELSLARAIDREQLRLFYQPQIDRGGSRIAGAEALLRWRDQSGRMVSPNVFIPLAEKTGQIHSIGLWVIEEACRQLHVWHSKGLRPGKVASNISALQLGAENPSLSELLAGALNTYDLVPENLELEITETALLNDPGRAGEQLRQLAESGFSLAIDDFGTGYSSLTMLHSLPLDKLKIDRFFVDRLGNDRCRPGHRQGHDRDGQGTGPDDPGRRGGDPRAAAHAAEPRLRPVPGVLAGTADVRRGLRRPAVQHGGLRPSEVLPLPAHPVELGQGGSLGGHGEQPGDTVAVVDPELAHHAGALLAHGLVEH